MRILEKISKIILSVIFPSTCLFCGRDQKYNYTSPLCPECFSGLEEVKFPYCSVCGTKLKSGGAFCRNCRGDRKKRYFSFSRSAYMFNPKLRAVIHAYKYEGYYKLSEWLGALMAEKFALYPEFSGYEVFLPVPVSRVKIKKRGFNQSELLALVLSRYTGIPVEERLLIKNRETEAQAGLDRQGREKNLSGAFLVPDKKCVEGRKIILVDDVATTLSTLNEVSKELMAAGAASVSCYTLSRE